MFQSLFLQVLLQVSDTLHDFCQVISNLRRKACQDLAYDLVITCVGPVGLCLTAGKEIPHKRDYFFYRNLWSNLAESACHIHRPESRLLTRDERKACGQDSAGTAAVQVR